MRVWPPSRQSTRANCCVLALLSRCDRCRKNPDRFNVVLTVMSAPVLAADMPAKVKPLPRVVVDRPLCRSQRR